jgi:hypothetical protein
MMATLQSRTNWVLRALMSGLLALVVLSGKAYAHDPGGEGIEAIAVGELSLWLKTRFSESELQALRLEDLGIELHYCGCYDRPKPHFPYPIVLFKTPRGDLVARPDTTEGAVSFVPLAVKHGERYCAVGSEQDCYGSFSEPCDFTDFRYGPLLEQFFPTCKSTEAESDEVAARR